MSLRTPREQDLRDEEVRAQLECRHLWTPRPGGGAECCCGAWWSVRELRRMAETGSPWP